MNDRNDYRNDQRQGKKEHTDVAIVGAYEDRETAVDARTLLMKMPKVKVCAAWIDEVHPVVPRELAEPHRYMTDRKKEVSFADILVFISSDNTVDGAHYVDLGSFLQSRRPVIWVALKNQGRTRHDLADEVTVINDVALLPMAFDTAQKLRRVFINGVYQGKRTAAQNESYGGQ